MASTRMSSSNSGAKGYGSNNLNGIDCTALTMSGINYGSDNSNGINYGLDCYCPISSFELAIFGSHAIFFQAIDLKSSSRSLFNESNAKG